jgi:hypothetical protein
MLFVVPGLTDMWARWPVTAGILTAIVIAVVALHAWNIASPMRR